MTKRRLTTQEVAKRLGVCVQRIAHRIKQGHFPHHERCECGRSIMIPESDVQAVSEIAERVDRRRKNESN